MSASTTDRTQEELFADGNERRSRTRNSMLWAAYADALGFISELVDDKGLKRRTSGAPLSSLMAWTRRIGGRGGVDVELPAGCWSDDTQLRMAVSRAIGPHGFDVEAFARVELTVWPAYALGGGRASKAAAANLARSGALWYANTFDGWTNAGGNGAAMRIQPHVWASSDLESDFMGEVIMDSVCSHGHPRAIVGACFHAVTLAHCLREGSVPDTNVCVKFAADIGRAINLFDDLRYLGSTWLGLWEKATDESFRAAWQTSVDELARTIEQSMGPRTSYGDVAREYGEMIERLGLRVADQRGSGILTPVAAVALASIAPGVHEAVVIAVNVLGTDTDTIATMAGALLGASHLSERPPTSPLDAPYLMGEADRLVGIANGAPVSQHRYPDLLTWAAPQTQADALVVADGSLVVEGLGSVVQSDASEIVTARGDFGWQWVRTAFGQTLLIKRRPNLRSLAPENSVSPPPAPTSAVRTRSVSPLDEPAAGRPPPSPKDRGVNLDAAVDHARRHIGDEQQLGYTLRRVARDGTLTDLVALVSALREDLRRG